MEASHAEPPKDPLKAWLGNLKRGVSERLLEKTLTEELGIVGVKKVYVHRPRMPTQWTSAFITFETPWKTTVAIKALDGAVCPDHGMEEYGFRLSCTVAKAKCDVRDAESKLADLQRQISAKERAAAQPLGPLGMVHEKFIAATVSSAVSAATHAAYDRMLPQASFHAGFSQPWAAVPPPPPPPPPPLAERSRSPPVKPRYGLFGPPRIPLDPPPPHVLEAHRILLAAKMEAALETDADESRWYSKQETMSDDSWGEEGGVPEEELPAEEAEKEVAEELPAEEAENDVAEELPAAEAENDVAEGLPAEEAQSARGALEEVSAGEADEELAAAYAEIAAVKQELRDSSGDGVIDLSFDDES